MAWRVVSRRSSHQGRRLSTLRESEAPPRESRVQQLAQYASIELQPKCVEQFLETTDAWIPDERLHARRTVFVNMLAGEASHFRDVGRSVALLSERGHHPIPTVPANVFSSESEAAATLKFLADSGAREAFIVAGKDRGPSSSSSSTGLTASALASVAAHHFERLAFPAFPEGGTPEGVEALERKLLDHQHRPCSVVTQWSADTRRTSHWLEDFLATHRGHKVYVGVAGPAPRPKLQSFSERTHVTLKPPRGTDLDLFHAPTDAVLALANDIDALNVSPKQVHLHLFSLKVARTLAFIHRLAAGTHANKGNLIP